MPEVQSRRLGHGEWPPALTRMFYARRNWPTLLRRHPARRETAAQAADLPEAAFQTHGRPRHLPILGPLLGGEAVHCPCEHCNKAACVGAAAHRHRPAYKQSPSDKPNRLSVRGHATKSCSSPIAQPGGISGFAGLLLVHVAPRTREDTARRPAVLPVASAACHRLAPRGSKGPEEGRFGGEARHSSD